MSQLMPRYQNSLSPALDTEEIKSPSIMQQRKQQCLLSNTDFGYRVLYSLKIETTNSSVKMASLLNAQLQLATVPLKLLLHAFSSRKPLGEQTAFICPAAAVCPALCAHSSPTEQLKLQPWPSSSTQPRALELPKHSAKPTAPTPSGKRECRIPAHTQVRFYFQKQLKCGSSSKHFTKRGQVLFFLIN